MSEAGEFMMPESRGGSNAAGRNSAMMMEVWSMVAAPRNSHEDRMDPEKATEVWNRIYALFGSTSGEPMRKEVKLAVYVYFGVNGTSQYGDYEGTLRLGSGISVPARDVVLRIGHTNLRRFCRAFVEEAYYALKGSGAMTDDSLIVAKAATKNLPADKAYLLADYLTACPVFSEPERQIYSSLFNANISRAGANRRGKTVDEISEDKRERDISAQRGALHSQNSDMTF